MEGMIGWEDGYAALLWSICSFVIEALLKRSPSGVDHDGCDTARLILRKRTLLEDDDSADSPNCVSVSCRLFTIVLPCRKRASERERMKFLPTTTKAEKKSIFLRYFGCHRRGGCGFSRRRSVVSRPKPWREKGFPLDFHLCTSTGLG